MDKKNKIAGMTTVKKLVNQCGHFEDTVIFKWQTMECYEYSRCPCVSITIIKQIHKYLLNIAYYLHKSGYVIVGFCLYAC